MTTWTCPATVVRVIDGDSVVCDLDLGYHVSLRAAVRIEGLAAPELATAAGKAARDYAKTLLPPGEPVTVESKKLLGSFEKYGRVLATVTRPADVGEIADFATVMIAAGHGVAWDGTGKQPK